MKKHLIFSPILLVLAPGTWVPQFAQDAPTGLT